MTYALGARSLSFVTHVDPRMVDLTKVAISISLQDFGFTAEQSRTTAEEAVEVREGFSHTMHSHHLIQDGSLGWEPTPSAFGTSGAVDAVPWDGTKFVWDWDMIYSVAAAFRQASITTTTPATWGGYWATPLHLIPGLLAAPLALVDAAARLKTIHLAHGGFADGPHFELGRN